MAGFALLFRPIPGNQLPSRERPEDICNHDRQGAFLAPCVSLKPCGLNRKRTLPPAVAAMGNPLRPTPCSRIASDDVGNGSLAATYMASADSSASSARTFGEHMCSLNSRQARRTAELPQSHAISEHEASMQTEPRKDVRDLIARARRLRRERFMVVLDYFRCLLAVMARCASLLSLRRHFRNASISTASVGPLAVNSLH
jgi:hypothetical protein